MPEEIIETEIGAENVTKSESETGTIEAITVVPSSEDSLFVISERLDSMYILVCVILFLLCILCLFTVIRRSD